MRGRGSYHRRFPLAALLPDVEGCLPDSDHSVAHPPCLEPTPRHHLAAVAVLPRSLPHVRQHVTIQREQRLRQPVVLLASQAGCEQLAESLASTALRLLG